VKCLTDLTQRAWGHALRCGSSEGSGKENFMRRRNEPQGLLARFSNPLLALLIAAVAAVGAIAQCGLMLDAAVVGAGAASAPDRAAVVSRVQAAAERPHIAAAPSVATSSETPRPN
jgi:hypothetical protein